MKRFVLVLSIVATATCVAQIVRAAEIPWTEGYQCYQPHPFKKRASGAPCEVNDIAKAKVPLSPWFDKYSAPWSRNETASVATDAVNDQTGYQYPTDRPAVVGLGTEDSVNYATVVLKNIQPLPDMYSDYQTVTLRFIPTSNLEGGAGQPAETYMWFHVPRPKMLSIDLAPIVVGGTVYQGEVQKPLACFNLSANDVGDVPLTALGFGVYSFTGQCDYLSNATLHDGLGTQIGFTVASIGNACWLVFDGSEGFGTQVVPANSTRQFCFESDVTGGPVGTSFTIGVATIGSSDPNVQYVFNSFTGPGWTNQQDCPHSGVCTPSTFIHTVSDVGDWVGGGSDTTIPSLLSAETTFTDGRQCLRIQTLASAPTYANLVVCAPSASLGIAIYNGASRSGGPGQATLDYSQSSHGCNNTSGAFSILDLQLDGSGGVMSAAVDFVQHCEGAAPAIHGSARFNSSFPDTQVSSGGGGGGGGGIGVVNP